MILKVNGRSKYYVFLSHLTAVGKGCYVVRRAGNPEPFHIEGGKKAGGTRRDWFVDHPSFRHTIKATSLVDALNLIDSM